jgi:AcrR family transcriptional regulator
MADLVARTGMAPSTIRYYVATGLIPPAQRVAPKRHLYDERHVEALRLVKLLKERRNLPIEEVRRILPDLLELPAGGAFRPEMWEQLVKAAASNRSAGPAGRIVDAGIAAFNRHGYAEVSVDDVCRRARIAKGSFYRYYESKEELFFASARETARRVQCRFAEVVRERSPSPPALTAEEQPPAGLLAALVEAIEPYLGLLLDLMALSAQRRAGHGRVLQEVFDSMSSGVRESSSPWPAAVEPDAGAEQLLERALVIAARRSALSPFAGGDLMPAGAASR